MYKKEYKLLKKQVNGLFLSIFCIKSKIFRGSDFRTKKRIWLSPKIPLNKENVAFYQKNVKKTTQNLPQKIPSKRNFPKSYFHRHFSATCDGKGNSCAFYASVSPSTCEMIIIFRGTTTKSQLLQEGILGMKPNMEFFGHGTVSFFEVL